MLFDTSNKKTYIYKKIENEKQRPPKKIKRFFFRATSCTIKKKASSKRSAVGLYKY